MRAARRQHLTVDESYLPNSERPYALLMLMLTVLELTLNGYLVLAQTPTARIVQRLVTNWVRVAIIALFALLGVLIRYGGGSSSSSQLSLSQSSSSSSSYPHCRAKKDITDLMGCSKCCIDSRKLSLEFEALGHREQVWTYRVGMSITNTNDAFSHLFSSFLLHCSYSSHSH